MKSKTTFVSLLACGLLATTALVQAEPPAGGPPDEHGPRVGRMREHRMKMLEEKLSLTPAQKQQIQAIWDQAEQQGKALRADESAAREQRREKMGAIMKDSHDKVRAVLTADQQKIFDSLPPEPRGRRGGPGGPRPAGGGD
ncbi:MAG TPA: Spy/CpxP family protein refolding chaperone, partial [Opitutaceae bacterium]|nr:Spy/CpxP family protein refolding chaperone [Opitutaceae bacterium]